MLEELARDVSGWPAHVVEFFQPARPHGARRARPLDRRLGRPALAGADRPRRHGVRRDGAHGRRPAARTTCAAGTASPNVGVFLWRLRAYPLERVPARRGDRAWRYFVSPLGTPGAALLALAPGGRRGRARDGAARPGPDPARALPRRPRGRRRPVRPDRRDRGEPARRPQRHARARAVQIRCRQPRPLALGAAAGQGDRDRRRRAACSPSAPASGRPRASTSPTTTASPPTSAAGRTTGAAGSCAPARSRCASRSRRASRTTRARAASAASPRRSRTGPRRDGPNTIVTILRQPLVRPAALPHAAQRPPAGARGGERPRAPC